MPEILHVETLVAVAGTPFQAMAMAEAAENDFSRTIPVFAMEMKALGEPWRAATGRYWEIFAKKFVPAMDFAAENSVAMRSLV